MSAPTPDPLTMRRLALIRLLYQQGIDQSHLPEPLTLTSVLAFHDAAELFLVLAGEYLGATLPDHIQFMKYWAELHPNKLARGVDLSGKAGMDRLNRLRNAFKHAGSLPGRTAVEQARADVASFFEDNTPKVFGLPFDRIDMADVVAQSDTSGKIKEAVATNASGNRIEAMALLVEAFDALFDQHLNRHQYRPSPFAFGGSIHHPLTKRQIHAILQQPPDQQHRMPVRGAEHLADEIDTIREIALATQSALRIIALGLDYSQYHRFRLLTPSVFGTFDGKIHRSHAPDYAPSQDEFDYCQQFVITVALRLAEHQALKIPPSWKNNDPGQDD